MNDCKVGKYQEEYEGKQFISLSGDTIIITKTDSLRYSSQAKSFSNDTLNYSEYTKKLNGFGTVENIKWYDTKYATRREDKFNFKAFGSDEGVKYNLSITNQFGTVDYTGKENMPIEDMQRRFSNRKSYKYDHNKNWRKGIFKKFGNTKITVTRKINYD